MSTDTAQDYYAFQVPNASSGWVSHRLGNFKANGGGQRQTKPKLGVLHWPQGEWYSGGDDRTAEMVAQYIAAQSAGVMVTGCTDRDSYVILCPFDFVPWGCANPNAYKDAIEYEIAGTGNEAPGYWSSEDARKKFVQTAKCIIQGAFLAYGDDWLSAVPPRALAKLALDGSVIEPGWLQHRDVPIWTGSYWAQPPTDNLAHGQHRDIAPDFPWDVFFEVLESEMANFNQGAAT